MRIVTYLLFFVLVFANCSSSSGEDSPQIFDKEELIELSVSNISFESNGRVESIIVKSNCNWVIESTVSWVVASISEGKNGETALKIAVDENDAPKSREAVVIFKGERTQAVLTIVQSAGVIPNYVPKGYQLVWNDEFDTPSLADGRPALPSEAWWFETGNHGWGNNELQNYIDKVHDNDTVSKIENGNLIITAFKREQPVDGSNIISARMNTKEAWLYGYFEMRAKLPGGKGTWAAFWMMPQSPEKNKWPDDGEIDILEYVGYRPNIVQSTIHTGSYNHLTGTDKSGTKAIQDAETKFHTYGLEWTADRIVGYVDGEVYFTYENDKENKYGTWPFNHPFYLKLNLAIGGNWGGLQGVDDSIFPAKYIIDYVRVYQKN